MATLRLSYLRILKSKLDLADPGDRLFYFQLGHLANEITILRKITLYALNEGGPINNAEREAKIAMALLAARFTAGRLNEGEAVINKQRNGRRLTNLVARAPSDPRIGTTFENGLAAQRAIGAYFGRPGNLIGRIRNKLAFHNDPEAMQSAYEALPHNEVLVDFLTAHMGDSFYGSAEIAAQQVMIQMTGLTDLNEASAKIHNEIIMLSGHFERFINAYRLAFVAIYAPEKLEYIAEHSGDIEVPLTIEVSTPYFTQPFEQETPDR